MSVDRSTVWPYEQGEPGAFVYSRYAHPTGVQAERELAALEGAPEGQALLFASGSAATTALLAALIGTVTAVVAGGVATIAIALSWTRLFPSLARMGRLEDLRPEPVARLAG